MSSSYSQTRPVLWVTGSLFLLIGIALAVGGVWLAALGGSWYYIAAAIGFVLTAILLFLRRPAALLVYALLVIGTLIWAYLEVGLDWWALAPRGDIVILLGLWLVMPWVTRALVPQFGDRPPVVWRGAGLALAASLAVSGIVAVLAVNNAPHRIDGTFEAASGGGGEAKLASAIPAGEWHAYGRTDAGQRYSPLKRNHA